MMRPHDGRIDHLYAALWALVLVQGPQHQFPDASQRPAPELPVHRRPLAEILVQITPGSTRARDPEYAVQHPSVILWRPTALPASRDHEWLEKRPLRVRHQTAKQNCLPKSSLESHRRSVVNPLCQRDLALLWQIFRQDCSATMRTAHWWWLCECDEYGLPDGGEAWLWRGGWGFFFSPLLVLGGGVGGKP